jgi:hypothetical protein
LVLLQSEQLFKETILLPEHLGCPRLYLYAALVNQEGDQLLWQVDAHTELYKILVVLGVLLGLVQLLILHQHNSDGQIEEEERADDYAKDKVHHHEPGGVSVLVDIHDLGPPFHSDTLENGQECGANVVKVREAVIQLVDI